MLATLRSNGGYDSIVFDFGPNQEYATDPGVLLNFDIRGEHWDGDHEHDLSTRIEGIWIRIADVVELAEHIAKWTRLSMVDLDPNRLDQRFQLCRLPGQQLDLEFGSVPAIVSGRNPVLTIMFASGRLSGSFCMVVDQSCLNLFVDEMSACIDLMSD